MKLVLIRWEDTYGCSAQWEKIEQPLKPKILLCESVGWLAYDGEDCKVVIPHMTDRQHDVAAHQGCGDMTIPTRAVREIVPLFPRKTPKRHRRAS